MEYIVETILVAILVLIVWLQVRISDAEAHGDYKKGHFLMNILLTICVLFAMTYATIFLCYMLMYIK